MQLPSESNVVTTDQQPEDRMGLHVIVWGNPVDGIQIIGPFTTADEAIEAAECSYPEDEWWVTKLHAIEEKCRG